jgi:uncharacterized protein YjiS (DUF1127 family)
MKRINALMNAEYRSQWQDRPVFLAPRPRETAPAAVWAMVREAVRTIATRARQARVRRITHRQLARLDDRLLADIGLRRDQLHEVSHGLLAGRDRAAVQRPAATVADLGARRSVGRAEGGHERAA